MSKLVDKIFSLLPIIIFLVHTVEIFYDFEVIFLLLKIIFTFISSFLLKILFKRNRMIKNYDFKKWNIPVLLTVIKSNYSLPSSHTMFYIKYFILKPSFYTFLIALFGSYSRIFYQHHRRSEILYSFLFIVVLEIIIEIINKSWIREEILIRIHRILGL